MHNKTYHILSFLVIFVLLWSSGLGAIPAFSLFDARKDMVDMSQEKVLAQTGEYSIPRNQVLLEIATGTW